ncbi:hypothetical protein ACLOJK_016956 [Asimina triloba]
MRGSTVVGRGRRSLLPLFSSKLLKLTFLCSAPTFCTDSGDGSRLEVFDRHLKRKQRDRAAWLMPSKDSFVDSVAENLLDRLEQWLKWCWGKIMYHHRFPENWNIAIVAWQTGKIAFLDCKKTFPTALCLGGSLGAVRRSVQKLVMMDMSYDMVKRCRDAEADISDNNLETLFVVGDEEFLPVKEGFGDQLLGSSLDKRSSWSYDTISNWVGATLKVATFATRSRMFESQETAYL